MMGGFMTDYKLIYPPWWGVFPQDRAVELRAELKRPAPSSMPWPYFASRARRRRRQSIVQTLPTTIALWRDLEPRRHGKEDVPAFVVREVRSTQGIKPLPEFRGVIG